MPPSRYRVVEQGRRLVVIDTQAGGPVHPVPSAPEMPGEKRRRMEAPRPSDRPAPRPTRPEPRGRYAGGEGIGFTTAPWFDKEAPRTIRINQEGQTQLGIVLLVLLVVGGFLIAAIGWPIAIVLGFLALNPKTRDGLRTAATTWITALDSSEG
ncbi:hypothetical protein P6144_08555 [Sphingomonas sp. HITSZ_GF]|uniref:hypothetical protein n=1 Tax=Sphingomonas sp. HITSZ_GF TaxID=3037247 RepID=UPI00240CF9A6|nr:hypothetical protein [Sphingomonas sp. HITSZ_GF]MDG2533694.1 hypothetical protein [Sphingomonas sp. HITSZ_GF]